MVATEIRDGLRRGLYNGATADLYALTSELGSTPPLAEDAHAESAAITTYPLGISIMPVSAAADWDGNAVAGSVVTFRTSSEGWQEFELGDDYDAVAYRTWGSGAPAWNAWQYHTSVGDTVARIAQHVTDEHQPADILAALNASTGEVDIDSLVVDGALSVDTPTLSVDPTNDEVMLGTITRDSTRPGRLFVRHDDQTKRGFSLVTQVDDQGSGVTRHPRPMSVWTDYRRTDAVAGGSESLSFGIHSVSYFGGNATPVAAMGNMHGISSDVVVVGNGSDSNEHCSLFGALRYDIGTGYTTSTGPSGRGWFTDYSVHGPIAVQPHLLNGITMLMNQHYNGTPTSGPAGAYWAVTGQNQGGSKDSTHGAAATYPVDVGFGVVGRAGDSGTPTTRRGFEVAFKAGGYGSGWQSSSTTVPSRLGTAFEANDWEAFGLRIRNRISGATGPAIAVDAANGPVVIGGSAANNAASFFEVLGADANADPLVLIGATAYQRAYSIQFRNSAGVLKFGVSGGASGFLTGTVAGDGVIQPTTAAKSLHLGGSTKVVTVTQDNKFAMWAGTPVVQPTGWTGASNLTTDRAFDANSVTLHELADVVGTLIADLKLPNYIGA